MLFWLANSSAVSNSTSLLSVKSALFPTWEDNLKYILDEQTEISFYQYPRKIWLGGELLNLVEPLLDVAEAHHVGHVEHDDDPQGTPVAAGQDGSVPLLTPGVPDLYLDLLVVDDSLPSPDVHSNRRDEVVCAGVIQEFVKQAGLSHTRVSDL